MQLIKPACHPSGSMQIQYIPTVNHRHKVDQFFLPKKENCAAPELTSSVLVSTYLQGSKEYRAKQPKNLNEDTFLIKQAIPQISPKQLLWYSTCTRVQNTICSISLQEAQLQLVFCHYNATRPTKWSPDIVTRYFPLNRRRVLDLPK